MNIQDEKIVITGAGLASSVALDLEQYYLALCSRQCKTKYHSQPCDEGHRPYTAKIKNFPDELKASFYFDVPLLGHYTLYAAKQGLKSAGLHLNELAKRLGIILATSYGTLEVDLHIQDTIKNLNPKQVSPLTVMSSGKDCITNLCAVDLNIQAFSHTIVGERCSGLQAVLLACQALRLNKADAILVGGCDSIPKQLAEFMNILEGEGLGAQNKQELVYGEGAAFVVLERESDAIRRGARILARISDICLYGEPGGIVDSHQKQQGTTALERGLERVMHHGKKSQDSILIYPGISGQAVLDSYEKKALEAYFQVKYEALPAISVKDYIGECFSASAIFQIIAACYGMSESGVKYLSDEYVSRYLFHECESALVTSCEAGGCVGALLLENVINSIDDGGNIDGCHSS